MPRWGATVPQVRGHRAQVAGRGAQVGGHGAPVWVPGHEGALFTLRAVGCLLLPRGEPVSQVMQVSLRDMRVLIPQALKTSSPTAVFSPARPWTW